MVFGSVTVQTIPGKRFAGIKKLTELAKWMSDKYEIRTQVLGNIDGQIYQNHLVTEYKDMAQAEEMWDKILSDQEYYDWFGSASEVLVWEGAATRWYRVHE